MNLLAVSRRRLLAWAAGGVVAPHLVRRTTIAQASTSALSPGKNLIDSVRNLGHQFLDNPVNVTGMDGATSTQLPSGGALWLFGDTVEGPFESIRGLPLHSLRSNTGAIVPNQTASQGIRRFEFLKDADGKRPRQVIPFLPAEDPAVHRIWPIHGVCVGEQIYVFYHRIMLLKGVDVFINFQLDGMGIARGTIGDLKFERLTAPDGTPEFWKPDAPTFGVFVEPADDYVYLWGSLMTGMFLARTRPEAVADLASYEYLVAAPSAEKPKAAPQWDKEFRPSASLFDGVPNEMSVSFNAHLKKFVAFHSVQREHKIAMRTAPDRCGPWSEPLIIYQPQKIKDDDLIYAAKEHPELARDGGRTLYVTFVNSTTYVPQLLEIMLR